MKLKTLIVSVAVLAVLSAIAYYASRPEARPPADTRVGQPLVSADAIGRTQKITLSDQGKTVTVVRQPDATWTVASYYDLPADFSKISHFVDDLSAAKVDRLVTTNPAHLARLDFKDTKIELDDAAGKAITTIVLGKTPDSGTGRFFRYGDEPKAFFTGLQAWLDTDPKNWADAQLLNAKADDIAKIEIPLDSGASVAIARQNKNDPWTAENAPAGRKLKGDAISPILSSLTSLRFTDTSALDDPAAKEAQKHLKTYRLTTFDGKTYTVALGRKPEEKKLKPPVADAKGGGPASLGKISDLKAKDVTGSAANGAKASEAKPPAPEFETIPAGPVFVSVHSSDGRAPINALMTKRAFQIDEYAFTSLPKSADDLFEAAPAPVAKATPAPTPAAPSQSAPTPIPAGK